MFKSKEILVSAVLLFSVMAGIEACSLEAAIDCGVAISDLIKGKDGDLPKFCQSFGPVKACVAEMGQTCTSDEKVQKIHAKLSAGLDLMDALCKLHTNGFDKAGCKVTDVGACFMPVAEGMLKTIPITPPFSKPCKDALVAGEACLSGIQESCDDGALKEIIQVVLSTFKLIDPDCDTKAKEKPKDSDTDLSLRDRIRNSGVAQHPSLVLLSVFLASIHALRHLNFE